MAAELAGVDSIRLYHDHALYKPPWGNPTNWHVDNPYDPFYSRAAIMLWVALDDATVQNGCLYFLDGTHLQGDVGVRADLSSANVGGLFRAFPTGAGRPVGGGGARRRRHLHQRHAGPRRRAQHDQPAAARPSPSCSCRGTAPSMVTPRRCRRSWRRACRRETRSTTTATCRCCIGGQGSRCLGGATCGRLSAAAARREPFCTRYSGSADCPPARDTKPRVSYTAWTDTVRPKIRSSKNQACPERSNSRSRKP